MIFRKRALDAEVPTASMADLAFLLIVFFMLTTVFSTNAGIDHVLPGKTDGGDPEPAVHVVVQSEASFSLDGETYPMSRLDHLVGYLEDKLRTNSRKPVILETDPGAPYGAMIRVLDQIRALERVLETPIEVIVPDSAERALYLR